MLFQIPKIKKFSNSRISPNFSKTRLSTLFKNFIPQNDLDRSIFKITTAASLNYLMNPLVGFVDTFWVGRLGTDLDIAGQGYADDIYNLIFGVFCFMSSFITPEIAFLKSQNREQQVKELNTVSILISFLFGLGIYSFLNTFGSFYLANQLANSPFSSNCLTYLKYRSLSIPFALANNTIFATLRGLFLFKTAFKLNLVSQLVNLILDPIMIQRLGLKGAAIASTLADIICTGQYLMFLKYHDYLSAQVLNFGKYLKKIFNTGILIQIRNIAIKMSYFLMVKRIISFDDSGKSMASFVICSKILDLGTIIYFGLGTVGYTLLPASESHSQHQKIIERLFLWTNWSHLLEVFYILFFYWKCSLFSTDSVIINNIRSFIPYIYLLLIGQGIGHVNFGILQGYQDYHSQAIVSLVCLVTTSLLCKYCHNMSTLLWLSIVITGIRTSLLHILKPKLKTPNSE